MKNPNRTSKTNNGKKRRKIEKRENLRFYFRELPKVYTKDVTGSLNRVEITLFFCASENFRCNKTKLIN